MISDLEGKTILVTGASRGIGAATVKMCIAQSAKVIALARNPEKVSDESLKENGDIKWYAADLSKIDEIEPAIKRICENEGKIDGFVHCAGISHIRPLAFLKKENMMEIFDVNYFSFIELSRCLTRRGRMSDGGSIVAISSIASRTGKAGKITYSASKAAIDASIRCMVCDLRKRKIRVNSIQPDWVDTDMYKNYMEKHPDTFEVLENKEKKYMGITSPDEIAATAVFLLSDMAVTITGTSVLVDGGKLQG